MKVLDPIIARSVLHFDSASAIWSNLQERFGQTSGTQIYSNLQQLAEMQQGTDSISSFYTKMKILWDTQDATQPLPICNCTNCNCRLTQKILTLQEEQRTISFLMKLNPNFSHVRANILMQYHLPPISHAYRLLAQEEEHKAISENIPEDSHAMFANKGRPSEHKSNSGIIPYRPPQSSEKSFSQRKSSYFCDYCKKTGHTKDRCYKLHGLPSNLTTKSNWKNNKVAALVDLENPEPHKLKSIPAGSNSFTNEQYNMLLHLINQQKKEDSPILAEDSNTACFLAGKQCLFSTNNALWIIDSGATNHITFNLDFF
ncbi:uncharacterized protein LOC130808419 [Amaranthus tricolor]|uniref:uncharacterized protein LOC130808419 n=1 Tax=Amaranthus tricolor TaxID=29722 RepID=UPI0025892340|nr:uncharacterized protein LOC130808419 [Amaranthus tricolor]